MIDRSSRTLRVALAAFRRLIACMPPTYSADQRADAIELTAKLASEAIDRRGIPGLIGVMLPAVLDRSGRSRGRSDSRYAADNRS